MTSTIKFSQFTDSGDLEPNQVTVGLEGGSNTRFTNPFPLLPPGTTGDRPTPAPAMYYRLRFNTTTEAYEYYSPVAGDWVTIADDTDGHVLPGLQNQLAWYAVDGDVIGGLATTNSAVLVTDVTGAPAWSLPMTDGEIIIGSFAGTPVKGTISAGSGINIVNGPGSITINNIAGTVNPGTQFQLAWYATTGDTISGLATGQSAILLTDSAGEPGWSASLTDGQLVIGVTGGTPVATTLTAGAGVSIANSPGSITISAQGLGIGWTEVTATSETMASGNGYVANNVGLVTLTLPASAAFGTMIAVQGLGVGGWVIAQNSGQSILFGNTTTTPGVTGSLASTDANDSVRLLCVVADTVWTVISCQGNITVN